MVRILTTYLDILKQENAVGVKGKWQLIAILGGFERELRLVYVFDKGPLSLSAIALRIADRNVLPAHHMHRLNQSSVGGSGLQSAALFFSQPAVASCASASMSFWQRF
jgi:hypothetical protein